MNHLDERITVRFFPGDRAKRLKAMKRYKNRWDNEGHFIRCAVIYYLRKLEQEPYEERITRRVKP